MKLLHETRINLYSKVAQPKICVLSDIHFSYQVKDARLDLILEKMRELSPDYIFIPGDLIDSNDMIFDKDEENRLLSWLKNLGEIAKVILSVGNHDICRKPTDRHRISGEWEVYENPEFMKKVNALENVFYLNNEKYEDSKIYVLGLTLSPDYYNLLDQRPSVVHPAHEKLNEILKELDDIDQRLITKLPKNKLKFVLIHSPVLLTDYRVKAELTEFDYFISGHMHNGIVPPIIDELWRSSTGFVSPTRNMLPRNIRTTRKTVEEKLIIAGAVTTWHECSGPLHKLNALYPSYFMTLNFSKDKQYEEKPYIKKKYLS
ncbi:metallophosphoesterase [Candidatus Saccharibacteria bacterium]|nr:metallophosphoesterase [Candidatus Saccharibacteria bacterium]